MDTSAKKHEQTKKMLLALVRRTLRWPGSRGMAGVEAHALRVKRQVNCEAIHLRQFCLLSLLPLSSPDNMAPCASSTPFREAFLPDGPSLATGSAFGCLLISRTL